MNSHKNWKELMELYARPTSEKFTKEEIQFLKDNLSIDDYRVRYAFYKKESKYNAKIAFCIDHIPKHWRPEGIKARIEFFETRVINELEFEELCENFGSCQRKYKVYYYRDVEHLIEEDAKYGIETPESFIKECKKRGYSTSQMRA